MPEGRQNTLIERTQICAENFSSISAEFHVRDDLREMHFGAPMSKHACSHPLMTINGSPSKMYHFAVGSSRSFHDCLAHSRMRVN